MRRFFRAAATWLEAIIAAFQFLTRLPLPVRMEYTDVHFRRSVMFYPFVGFMIGAVLAGSAVVLGQILPPAITGILAACIWTLITGALHLDGLMDTADGLLSHRPRERMLEIMKDSRSGPMGVMACVFDLMLKSVALMYLAEHSLTEAWLLFMLVPVWSRTFMVYAIYKWPYARKEQGMGSLYRSVGWLHAWAARAVALLITIAFIWPWTGINAKGLILVLGLMAIAYGVGTLLASAVSRKLHGLTGDVYGALNELIELSFLMGIVMYIHNAW